jgi:hypothetical protein
MRLRYFGLAYRQYFQFVLQLVLMFLPGCWSETVWQMVKALNIFEIFQLAAPRDELR